MPQDGTLETFYTDAGSRWLSYCYVGIDALPGVPSLELDVYFIDDEGNRGSVHAVITRFR